MIQYYPVNFDAITFDELFDLVYRRIQRLEGTVKLIAPTSDYNGNNFQPLYEVEIFFKLTDSEYMLRSKGRTPADALKGAAKEMINIPYMDLKIPIYG